MAFLLDTHIFLWAAYRPERLNGDVRSLLEDTSQQLFVSAITVAELMIKQSIGKLRMDDTPDDLREQLQLLPLDLTWRHSARLASIPVLHRDPFDRLLISQAAEDDMTLVTDDDAILEYPDVRLMSNH